MIESILDTKVKIKIAKLFVEREEPLQISDVAKILTISKSRASECLKELAEKGVLESRVIGRSVVYKLSSSSTAKIISLALTGEKALLSEIEKSVVLEVKRLKPLSLALFGSALKGLKAGNDIDFILLYENDLKKEKIYEIATEMTKKFGFSISILAMSVKEFKTKARKGEEFVLNVLANYKLLYGKELEAIVW